MSLVAFIYPTGYHVASWRHPDAPADAGVNLAHYVDVTRIAERGKFDCIFLPDSSAMRGTDLEELSRSTIRYVAQFEPLTLLGALAASTDRIGLTATVSASYAPPYQAARMLASLDHLSGGRTGWNLVTSQNPEECYNFGLQDPPDHAERYRRAAEFFDVVTGLWDTWEDDAFVCDKPAGRFFRVSGLQSLNHQGDIFSVRGPLNVPRGPQGHPVTLQAGSSEAGKDLAARCGEVIFTAQPTLAEAHAFYDDVKSRLSTYQREARELRILPGVFPYVGRTHREAVEKFEQLQELVDPAAGLALLESELGHVDLSGYDLDGPLPALPASNAGKGRQALLIAMAERDNLTIRQLFAHVAGSRGHWQVIGTAAEVADQMQEWFEAGAADGFMVMAPVLPSGLSDFVDVVVPELQRRGLFRKDYQGTTLRDHLGLKRPERRRF